MHINVLCGASCKYYGTWHTLEHSSCGVGVAVLPPHQDEVPKAATVHQSTSQQCTHSLTHSLTHARTHALNMGGILSYLPQGMGKRNISGLGQRGSLPIFNDAVSHPKLDTAVGSWMVEGRGWRVDDSAEKTPKSSAFFRF